LDSELILEREYIEFKSITDNYEKYVVTMDDIQFPGIEGIRHIQVWNLNTVL